jgi:3-phenylpropionate/trans-cinnamate dioxygenase ferredoxin subunit
MPARALVRHHVGAVADFEDGRFKVLDIDGRPVGVVKTAQGFFAVRNRCPHQGADICAGTVGGTMVSSAPYEYEYSEDTLVVACPWHRWEFELATGESFGRITNKKLVTYAVEVEDGEVYVMMRGGRA